MMTDQSTQFNRALLTPASTAAELRDLILDNDAIQTANPVELIEAFTAWFRQNLLNVEVDSAEYIDFFWAIRQLTLDAVTQGYFSQNPDTWQSFERMLNTFTSDHIRTVATQVKAAYRPNTKDSLRNATSILVKADNLVRPITRVSQLTAMAEIYTGIINAEFPHLDSKEAAEYLKQYFVNDLNNLREDIRTLVDCGIVTEEVLQMQKVGDVLNESIAAWDQAIVKRFDEAPAKDAKPVLSYPLDGFSTNPKSWSTAEITTLYTEIPEKVVAYIDELATQDKLTIETLGKIRNFVGPVISQINDVEVSSAEKSALLNAFLTILEKIQQVAVVRSWQIKKLDTTLDQVRRRLEQITTPVEA